MFVFARTLLRVLRGEKMHKKFELPLFLVSAGPLLALSACSLGAPGAVPQTIASIATVPLPAPTNTAAFVTATATAIPATVTPLPPSATPEPTLSPWEGDWSGKTSQDANFQFQIKGNQIVFFNVNYQNQSGSCIYSGSFGDQVSAPLVGNQFTIEWSDRDSNKALIAGTIAADGRASGTIDYTDNVKQVCDKSMKMSWNALSAAAIAAGTPEAPPVILGKPAGVNGKWEGKNQDGRQVSFTIENDQLTYVVFNYSINTGGCSLGGGIGQVPEGGAIANQSFRVNFKDNDGRLFTFSGSFSSDSVAAGVIDIEGKAGTFCGEFKSTETWTAQKAGAEAEPTAIVAPPTETSAAIDPANLVQGFFDAINAGNLEAALLFADDPVFNFGSSVHGIGNAGLKNYLNSQTAAGVTYSLSNIKAVGDAMVKFIATASDGTTYPDCLIMLNRGKIVIIKMQ
jgi:hypothetical protein